MKMPKPVKLTSKTPIMRFKGINTKTEIFIKRDDLNGLLISGNKARKLEYLIADALNKRCDSVITCGPVQSNHCRTTVAFARNFGLFPYLFLRGRPKKTPNGNLLIDRLLDARITYITPSEYHNKRTEIMAEYAKRLIKKGKRPYIIPEGGSNEIGALGYLDCMREMADFIKKKKVDALYCAVGSGGTYAGLLLGKKILKLNIELNGVIICDTVQYFTDKILKICEKAVYRFGMKIKITRHDINLIDGYVGSGYAIPYPEELEVIRKIAKTGIILEPVYTGKAFYGMLQTLKKKKYKRVIFMHTGGLFSIFAFNRILFSKVSC